MQWTQVHLLALCNPVFEIMAQDSGPRTTQHHEEVALRLFVEIRLPQALNYSSAISQKCWSHLQAKSNFLNWLRRNGTKYSESGFAEYLP
jgi:hypothetical protein